MRTWCAILLLAATAGCAGRRLDLRFGDTGDASRAVCRAGENRLEFTILNTGGRASIASTTVVAVGSHPPQRLPTRPVPPRGYVVLELGLPSECRTGCVIRIVIDDKTEVEETDEQNNVLEMACPSGRTSSGSA